VKPGIVALLQMQRLSDATELSLQRPTVRHPEVRPCGSTFSCQPAGLRAPAVAHSLVNMIVYTDVITGDEMMTDAFKQHPVKDAEGNEVEGLFEVRSAPISKLRLRNVVLIATPYSVANR
jgi:Translationally controlled tumour protein